MPQETRERVRIEVDGKKFVLDAPKGMTNDDIIRKAIEVDPEFSALARTSSKLAKYKPQDSWLNERARIFNEKATGARNLPEFGENIKSLLKKLRQEGPISTISDFIQNQLDAQSAAVAKRPTNDYKRYLAAVPAVGPALAEAEDLGGTKGIASLVGTIAGAGIASKIPELQGKVADLTGRISELGKSGTREFIGAGKSKVSEVAEGRRAAAETEKEGIKSKYAEEIGETSKKAKQASASQSAAESKQAAFSTKRGPVYKKMTEIADDVTSRVQGIDKAVRKRENDKWEAFKKGLGDATQNAAPVAEKISDVEQRILSTEGVPVFKKIMEELAAEDPLGQASIFRKSGAMDVKELLRNPAMGEAARQRILRSLEEVGETPEGNYIPQATVPIDYLRKLSTKLGQKMYSSVPSDVYRALKEVQGTVESLIESKIKEKMGKTGIDVYRKLKSDWREFMEVFYDKDSPVAKLREAKDPNDRLNPIVGDEGQRAIQLLSRYRDIGGGTVGLMGRLRALHKALRELPAKKGNAPKAPERPSLNVETKPTDPESIRRELIQKKINEYGNPTRWELRLPPLRAEAMLIKALLEGKVPGLKKLPEWLIGGPQ